ncbi:MAG: hypothetical protein JJT88_16300 [Gammaproteobacteria bacterium]|nr:hypothetical protein [Gammaproteobacteria bacterium]
MASIPQSSSDPLRPDAYGLPPTRVANDRVANDADAPGVSWSAVLAGAAGAAALSLLLIMLGSAFGFAVLSPWIDAGAAAIGIGAILWLTFTHVIASGLGGYLAGRLRVKWTSVHNDEVYFRDTAHGFLTWSLSTILLAVVAGSTLGALLSQDVDTGAGRAAAEGAGMAMATASNGAAGERGLSYHMDLMFRPARSGVEPLSSERRDMAVRVITYSLVADEMSARDRQYLGQMLQDHTGMGQQEAEQHVDAVFLEIRAARDDAREVLDDAAKASALAFGWMVVAMLMGAFFASFAATFGGRHRDA